MNELYKRFSKAIPNPYIVNELYYSEDIGNAKVFSTKNQRGFLHLYKFTVKKERLILDRFYFNSKKELIFIDTFVLTEKDDEVYKKYLDIVNNV